MIERLREMTCSVISGRWYIPSLCLLTALALCSGLNLAGGMALAFIAMWVLVFSDDTLSALCPVMFAVMSLTSFYTNYYALTEYAWVTVPFAAALLVHIFAYRGKFVRGQMFYSLAGVSIALIVGGIGVIPPEEYFSPIALYYMLGLGGALLVLYILLCSRFSRPRGYDIVERFAALLYGLALMAALIIVLFYVRNWEKIVPDFKTPFISYRNFCTTMMLFGLPMSCLFARRSAVHLLGMAFIYLMMLVGGSRSGLLFGSAELVMCLGYVYIRYPEKRADFRRLALIFALPAAVICGFVMYKLFFGAGGRFGQHLIRPDEARPSFYRQGFIDFFAQPLLGYGIGNMKNIDIYEGVNGSISFYHNSILQVMGSLGIVGCAAYLFQFVERVRLLWSKRHKDAFIMTIAFIGILLMSQTNPGLFCPLPTAALLVIMFAVVEYDNSADRPVYVPVKSRSKAGHTVRHAAAGVATGN